jgi:hypothetical protein
MMMSVSCHHHHHHRHQNYHNDVWSRTHLSEGDRKRSNAASTITNCLSGNITIGLDPIQNLLNGLTMTITNVHLNTIRLSSLSLCKSYSND